jgi:hypothetical protein
MANIQLSTNTAGTFKLNYTATDESGNNATEGRNVFILPNVGEATLNLEGAAYVMLNATSKDSDTIEYIGASDPGVIAKDQYDNDVPGYVRIQHFRHLDGNSNGELIYDTDDNTKNTPITNNVDPEHLWMFNYIAPPDDPIQLSPSKTDLKPVELSSWGFEGHRTYFVIKYTLGSPITSTPITVQRVLHVRDNTAPVFSFEGIPTSYSVEQGDPNGTVNTNENDAVNKYKYEENYWNIGSKNFVGYTSNDNNTVARKGFELQPVKYSLAGGPLQDNIDVNTKGTWTAHHKFRCSYTIPPSTNVLNYLADSNETVTEKDGKLYEITRTISISQDNVAPIIEFLPINRTYGQTGTIVTSSGGGTDTQSNPSSEYGTITITVPIAIGNTTDDASLASVLGDSNDNFLEGANPVEIRTTDNIGTPTITYKITQQTLNFTSSDETLIRRTHLGTDFSDVLSFDVSGVKIAGTVAQPAIFTITYTATDSEGNSSTASRRIKVIDSIKPTIEFSNNNNSIYGTALTFAKDSGSGTKTVVAATTSTIDDNFGNNNTVVLSNTNVFRSAYPKNVIDNIFMLEYDSNTSKFFITDLYGTTKTINNYLTKSDVSTYYFDLSSSTLSSFNQEEFHFFVNDTLVNTGADYNPTWTSVGSYNAYNSIDVAQIANLPFITIKYRTIGSVPYTQILSPDFVFQVSN